MLTYCAWPAHTGAHTVGQALRAPPPHTHRFLHAAKAVYFSAFAKHYLLPSELDELQEATEEAIDGCQGPLDDWALVSRAAQVPGWVRLLLRAQSLPLVGPLVMRLFLSVVKSSVRVAATFVYAHRWVGARPAAAARVVVRLAVAVAAGCPVIMHIR